MDAKSELERAKDFRDVFTLVKRIVEGRLGIRRAGLMLVLADEPVFVLAYHGVGTNFIVLNRRVISALVGQGVSPTELKSYLFTVLLHEYLHSLGYVDESDTRRLVMEITRSEFGDDHPAFRFAVKPLGEEEVRALLNQGQSGPSEPRLVRHFDDENLTYVA
ncbi:MAG: hypothetical protein NZ988_04695 [Thaumarchaeota archaeon]|nr:hypothetical protein [Candidatus Calditenuaceae archaeon]MDW8187326.1 hypothetical protein [Nitrososphaerota archaeon]